MHDPIRMKKHGCILSKCRQKNLEAVHFLMSSHLYKLKNLKKADCYTKNECRIQSVMNSCILKKLSESHVCPCMNQTAFLQLASFQPLVLYH